MLCVEAKKRQSYCAYSLNRPIRKKNGPLPELHVTLFKTETWSPGDENNIGVILVMLRDLNTVIDKMIFWQV